MSRFSHIPQLEAFVANKLRFLHIPKSAGTTFSNCLRRVYKADRLKHNVFVFYGSLSKDIERYQTLSEAERTRIVLYVGHAPLTTGQTEIDILPTITFLRDPIERLKSYCQAVSEEKVPSFAAKDFDLDQLLAGDDKRLNNFQTRSLLGKGSYTLPAVDDDILVEQTLEVLCERLACFGITERFDDSLLLFTKNLGWGTPPIYTRLNEKSKRRNFQFTEAQLIKIREINQVDIRVYEAAFKIFNQRLAEQPEYFSTERAKMHRRQNIFGRFLLVYRAYYKLQTIAKKTRNKLSL